MLKRLFALFICITMVVCIGTVVIADEKKSNSSSVKAETQSNQLIEYYSYASKFSLKDSPVLCFDLDIANPLHTNAEFVENYRDKSALVWENSKSRNAKFTFAAEDTGWYKLKFEYLLIKPNVHPISFDLKIDDAYPFVTAQSMKLPCYFITDDVKKDSVGNDIRPNMNSLDEWIYGEPLNSDGVTNDGYHFYLVEGTHTLTLENISVDLAISSISFYNDEKLGSYNKVDSISNNENCIIVEAEKTALVNDIMLYPTADNTNIDTSPSSPYCQLLNTIGGSKWKTVGQCISWEVEVPETGYYCLGIRYRQNVSAGLTSFRTLRINDEIPFAEAEKIPFKFSQKWQNEFLGSEDGEPWLVKLNKGKNTFSLTATLGDNISVQSQLKSLMSKLNTVTRKIILITSANPDTLRDYNLEKEIPELMGWLKEIYKLNLKILNDSIESGNDISGQLSCLEELENQLKNCILDPDLIPSYLTRLQSSYSSISALMLSLMEQPLEIDYFCFTQNSNVNNFEKANIFSRFGYWLKRLISSYSSDYTTLGDKENGEKEIDVWVNLGREQSKIVQTLSNQYFTEKSNIAVNVSLVNQSVVTASLSGKGPDVLLFVAESDPIDLALRHAACALDSFKDYDDVLKNFRKASMTSYQLNGYTYALPLTDTFSMMFYRTDIFNELSIVPPKTWKEFYDVLQVLQHNNLTAGIPVENTFFYTLINQAGGNFYNEDLSQTNLLSNESLTMFRQWTDLYRQYGLSYAYSFINRFRSGEMPLAIENYTQYVQLEVGAPEIKGLWKMLPIPGFQTEDGINNVVCGTGTAAVIMKSTDDSNSAWEFLKWFVSADIQTQFGNELESILGVAGRYSTANINSINNLGWDSSELQVLSKQFDNMFKLPKVPGYYMVEREISNAFRQVVYHSQNSRDTLIRYSQDINSEISRKRKEFGMN